MNATSWMERWRGWARRLKALVLALSIACRDPRTPWLARIVAMCVVAYALSPIDLIPDPIPVLGYLDDLILLPIGIALAVRLIPREVWADAVENAVTAARQPVNKVATSVIIAIWITVAAGVALLVWRWWY